ncbi:MAG TPA: histidine kinase dimerization/phospho-acceptor domain-containing protein, partial [Kofleriaceae bacterium]
MGQAEGADPGSDIVEGFAEAFFMYDGADQLTSINGLARRFTSAPLGSTFEEVVGSALAADVFDLDRQPADEVRARWNTCRRDAPAAFELRLADGGIVRVTERRTARGRATTISNLSEHVILLERASAFLSWAVHELRTPLNTMMGFTQLVQRDRKHPLPVHQQEWLAHATESATNMQRIVDELADVARFEVHQIVLVPAPVRIDDIVTNLVELLEPFAT